MFPFFFQNHIIIYFLRLEGSLKRHLAQPQWAERSSIQPDLQHFQGWGIPTSQDKLCWCFNTHIAPILKFYLLGTKFKGLSYILGGTCLVLLLLLGSSTTWTAWASQHPRLVQPFSCSHQAGGSAHFMDLHRCLLPGESHQSLNTWNTSLLPHKLQQRVPKLACSSQQPSVKQMFSSRSVVWGIVLILKLIPLACKSQEKVLKPK